MGIARLLASPRNAAEQQQSVKLRELQKARGSFHATGGGFYHSCG